MRAANEEEIENLQNELALALSGDLELTLDGVPVANHNVTVPYFSRVLESLQASYRAMLRWVSTEPLRRPDTTLSLSATGPGSFVAQFKLPPTQLEFDNDPIADRAMAQIVDLLASAEAQTTTDVVPEWASRTDEPAVRSMVRFAVALASSGGTTVVRWRRVSGEEQLVRLSASAARSLVLALTGDVGREVVEVVGHLEMASDTPPRIRIRTEDDEYLATVTDREQLERVKGLLFEEVSATLVVDTRTSPTTGRPDVHTELLQIDPA
jgi:hypothetical protein